MIFAADFLKWLEIFNIKSGGGGGTATLQSAYNAGSSIVIATGNPINFTDTNLLVAMNLDPSSRKMYTDYNIEAITGGITSHTLNQLITGNVTITQNNLDRNNVNNTTNNYILTFPTSDVFANGSEIGIVQQMSGGSVTLVFPTGVFLNGTDNTSIILNVAWMNVLVKKIAPQQYMTIYESPGLITFQQVYKNSLPVPNFQVGIDGFSITDPSSNFLMYISTLDNVNFSLKLGAQNNISLSNIINGGYTQFSGNNILNYIPIDAGVNNANFTFTAKSSIPSNISTTAGLYQFGFSNESSSPSGFFKLNVVDNGTDTNILYATGNASGNVTRVGINSQLTVGINYGDPATPNAALLVSSNIQGFLPPVLNSSQQSTLLGFVSPADAGLQWYNSNLNVMSYFDGAGLHYVLTPDHIVQGANMIVTDNGNGTVTLASTGGGSTGTQVQGSFNSINPLTSTPVTSADTPIAVSSSFNVVNAVGTNVALLTISGVQTAIIQNTSTSGRWCSINYDITLYVPVNSGQTYGFTVYTNTGAVAFFKQFTVSGTAPFYRDFTIAAPMVFLNTNDYVYLTVNSSLSGGPAFNAYYFNGRLIDTTISSIPNTDALPQGSSNLFLSQNGGTTYEYFSGIANVGHLVEFNSSGGQLIDSGISSLSIMKYVLVTGTTQQIDMNTTYIVKSTSTVNFTLPPTNSGIGVFEIIGTGSADWIVNQNPGQFVLYNGISTTPSSGNVSSSTFYDYAKFSYAGDSSGQFNIAIFNGNQSNLS